MNTAERTHIFTWCREYLDRLEHDADKLHELAQAALPDGYPPTSGGGAGSPGTVSDRTGQVAVKLAEPSTRDDKLPVNPADRVFSLLKRALSILEDADKARRSAFPLNEKPPAPGLPQGCRSHARLKDHRGEALFEPLVDEEDFAKKFGKARANVAVNNGLCWTCAAWADDHASEWPSIWLLDRLHRGARLTSKLAEEAELRAKRAS